ncbi:MAG: nuclear transport factor 2 family protein [Caulobacteraceae bacterium]
MPNHDIVATWEEHLRTEFMPRDGDAPTNTMTSDPYVNHVPTMTGGVGLDEVKRFYKYHFGAVTPPDIEITPVSRTVGTDSVVDEMVIKFTHTCVMDFLLPGIAPTGRRVEIPTVAIAQFRDGKLAGEHIYWDQASVLVQIGRLDPAGLPVAGAEIARKVLDQTLPSNRLMAQEWPRSEGQPI